MLFTMENNTTINIPDVDIDNLMEMLELSKDEAISLWLDDHEYTNNEEQDALDTKAKSVKISHEAGDSGRTRKQYVRQASMEKIEVFDSLFDCLEEKGYKFQVLKSNKLILLEHGGKQFKIDLIEVSDKKRLPME